ncbi:MAG TPA: 4Fe-4S dicluster domain-containing protein, partial [Spirochaetia bacterium]|nr:4Fe-4S dicluster domain-containing protein [Spirochaetia bacterium]
ALITYAKPSGKTCRECGACNRACPMDVNVQSYISAGKKVRSTECIGCGKCKAACPAGAIA